MSAVSVEAADPGWSARLQLGFRAGPERTVLAERRRHGPLAVQRPFYPEGATCHVYLLHPPGGVVGGDRLEIDVQLPATAQALITTPGATKFYRSAGAPAQQSQLLKVADGAGLEWLPQENILFPGARAAVRTRVELQGDARLLLWEIHCLGRPVIDEAFDQGALDASLELWRDGQPLLLERLRVDADKRLRPASLAACPVTATAVFSHADTAALEQARTLIDAHATGQAAATRVEDLLLIRYLGRSTEQAKLLFLHVWRGLREQLMRRPAQVPRIWNT